MIGLIFIFPRLAPFVLKVLNGWSAFEVKLDASQVDEAAKSLVKIAAKFKHNPPTALAVIVGKSSLAYRREEDDVYVLPLTSLKA